MSTKGCMSPVLIEIGCCMCKALARLDTLGGTLLLGVPEPRSGTKSRPGECQAAAQAVCGNEQSHLQGSGPGEQRFKRAHMCCS